MKLEAREKTLLIICGIIIAGLLYVWFVFIPQNKAVDTLASVLQENEILYTRAANKDVRLKAIRKEISVIDKEIAAKKQKFSKPIRVPEILKELNDEAAKNNIVIDVIEFAGDAAAVKGKYKTVGQGMQASLQEDSGANGIRQSGSAEESSPPTEAQKLISLSITLSFTGSYDHVIAFLKHFENNTKTFVIKSLDTTKNDMEYSVKAQLEVYSLNTDNKDISNKSKSVE